MQRLSLLLTQKKSSQITLLINNLIQQWHEEDDEFFNYVFLFFNPSPSSPLREETWITNFADYEFFIHFRMSKTTFSKLLTEMNNRELEGPNLEKRYNGGGEPISPERQLLVTLSWLGQGHTLLSVSDIFKVSPSTVLKCSEVILDKIIFLKNKYIVWPNLEEMAYIENEFRVICGYPGVIGAIDGTNVKFKAPASQQDSYIDKKMDHSIKLQAIVTANKLFTNINVGFSGSVHDARVFTNSSLYLDIVSNGNLQKYFPSKEYHLIGDKAYPLLSWLITPYKNYGTLSRRQINHNTGHSKTRITVEHIFGYLKPRWKILKYINVNSVEKAIKVIAASCVLHNFCYLNEDFHPAYEEPEVNVLDEENAPGYNIQADQEGIIKRDNISMLFI